MNFDHIFNWRLLAGSHDFPGPDGGTCINEAAIVAAGFPYRKIKSAENCPPCFSRPIAAYAIADPRPDGGHLHQLRRRSPGLAVPEEGRRNPIANRCR